MLKKLGKSIKKDLGRSTWSKVLFKGKGNLGRIVNPISGWAYQLNRKAINGIKRGTWSANLLKHTGGGSRRSVGTLSTPTHTSRSLASLTTR